MKSTARFIIHVSKNLTTRFFSIRSIQWEKILIIVSLFAMVSSSGFTLQVQPRVITPNGDGWNDKALFQFDNPAILPSRGEVFDLSGAKVADMVPGPTPDTTLVWDGTTGGYTVPSGVYIFQIEVGKNIMTGAVVIAQ
jgi:hypothetical protein